MASLKSKTEFKNGWNGPAEKNKKKKKKKKKKLFQQLFNGYTPKGI